MALRRPFFFELKAGIIGILQLEVPHVVFAFNRYMYNRDRPTDVAG